MRLSLLVILASNLALGSAHAHYHMLIPDKNSVKTDESVTLTYQFGHPFEHELFDTAMPESATIYLPDGTAQDVKAKLKKIEVAGEKGKKFTAYQLTFKPDKRGDYTVVFNSPGVTIEGEKEPIHDTAKVVVHVQTQNGWDQSAKGSQLINLTPLTRPYALRAGMLFRATFTETEFANKMPTAAPIASAIVEVEKYNPVPPKELPPDEHTTYTCRTDEKGVLATTLPDPGWWAVTAIKHQNGTTHRCTFWVRVDDKIPLKPAE